jgi:hypothetical protein
MGGCDLTLRLLGPEPCSCLEANRDLLWWRSKPCTEKKGLIPTHLPPKLVPPLKMGKPKKFPTQAKKKGKEKNKVCALHRV